MPSKKPSSAKECLDSLPEAQRKTVLAVRKVILGNLPKGYKESLGCGYIKIYEASRSGKGPKC